MSVNEEHKQNIISLHSFSLFLYERGMFYYEQGNLEKSIFYLMKASRIDKDNSDVLYQLGIALTECNELEEANNMFTHVLQLDKTYQDCYYFLAYNYASLGLFEESQRYAETYIEVSDKEQYVQEMKDILELVTMEEEEGNFLPQDKLIINQEKVRAYIRDGHFDDAINLAGEMLIEYPTCWVAYNHMAIALFQQGEYKKAIDTLEELLEKNPFNLHALCNKMMFYYSLGNSEEVNILKNILARLYPFLPEHQMKLGIGFSAIGEWELGYKWLSFLRRGCFIEDISFCYWLSVSAYKTGHISISKKIWKHVLDHDSSYEGYEPWNRES